MPLVSIIIPSFNRSDIINFTIDSIISQTYQEWELLIVDDGSTDATEEVVSIYAEKDTRIRFIKRPITSLKGANTCRNIGFAESKGDYIKRVDSDDILIPSALEKQVDIMAAKSGIKCCFAYGKFFSDSTNELEESWARKYTSEDLLWDYIRNNTRWPIGGPLWRKDTFEYAPFNEKLKNSQEWLMHGQQVIKLRPAEYYFLPEDIYLIRRGNARMSSNRTNKYYLNSAKSRFFLLIDHLSTKDASARIIIELAKQVLIYSYHAARTTLHSEK